MKFFVVFIFAGVVFSVLGAPQGNPNDEVRVNRYENQIAEDGSYKFVYELSDGQIRSEAGTPTQIGEEKPVIVVGSYSFVAPDGIIYWVRYTADENGYHPIVGTGEGGIKPGDDIGINPNALKSLIG